MRMQDGRCRDDLVQTALLLSRILVSPHVESVPISGLQSFNKSIFPQKSCPERARGACNRKISSRSQHACPPTPWALQVDRTASSLPWSRPRGAARELATQETRGQPRSHGAQGQCGPHAMLGAAIMRRSRLPRHATSTSPDPLHHANTPRTHTTDQHPAST